MHVTSDKFSKNAADALHDPFLQGALQRATGKFVNERLRAVAEYPGFEALRDQGRAIKQEALDRLPELLEQFEEKVIERGGFVHWARDAHDANQIAINLARSEGVKVIVKSKSMTTEETNLNHALTEAGFEAVETDLGEYILQLDDDYPSHILAPAIHKTKEQVADIFDRRLHEKNPPDAGIPGLNTIARRALRTKFLSAQMGITGANFAVAETGTIVIVENEGNAALSTTLPKIHVAFVGIEKIVPRFNDLAVMLKLLPRSATGQRMSSYTNFLTGAARAGEEGPQKLHIILLDNGRTKIYADEKLQGSLRCIRCGACLNVCPVYQKVGGHAYGWVYPGPIGAVISPQYLGLERGHQLPFASSLCGACYEVCPVKIEIPHMLLELRNRVVEENTKATGRPAKRTFFEALSFQLFAVAARRPWLWGLGSAIGRRLLRSKASGGTVGKVELPVLRKWTSERDLAAPAEQSFLEQWKQRSGSKGGRA
ncbi:MAG: iron-sulfur cluster-binding protein [Planctomycetes bacterium]|nr:iron-sulfur cluster-binding protein [Planctomycetota bacterium]